jgi:hypothetical protein
MMQKTQPKLKKSPKIIENIYPKRILFRRFPSLGEAFGFKILL